MKIITIKKPLKEDIENLKKFIEDWETIKRLSAKSQQHFGPSCFNRKKIINRISK